MSEREPFEATSSLVPSLVAGLVSGFMYGTAILGLVFLLPVQITYGRRGRKAGLYACLFSFAVGLAFEVGKFLSLGGQAAGMAGQDLVATLGLAAIPLAFLLAGLAIMNAPFWSGSYAWARGYAGVLPATLAAIPGLVWLKGNTSFLDQFVVWLKDYADYRMASLAKSDPSLDLEPLKAQLASMDFRALVDSSILFLSLSFVGFLLLFMAGSWWLGNRFSGAGSPGRIQAGYLSNYRLPYTHVWAFLGSWTGVLLVTISKVGLPWQALAWNLAIASSLAYTLQGLGIVSHYVRRAKMPGMLRISLVLTGLALLLKPPFGTAVVAVLPLLGVTEVWIPYRNPKGVGA